MDPSIISAGVLAWNEHLIGRSDQALRRSRAVVARAREEPSRLYELALAQGMAAGFHQFRREKKHTRDQAEAAVSLCSEQGFAEILGISRWVRGWALSELGQEEDGIQEMAEGIEGYRSCGSKLFLSWPLGLLAWAHGNVGQIEKAFGRLAEAFKVVEQIGERFYEAELFRLKGELLLKRPAPDEEPEACFRQAIAVARRQSARTWELRATTSLARLLAKQARGRKPEPPRRDLRLVHRGIRHVGFEGREGAPRRALVRRFKMRCGSCTAENPEHASFCLECGARLGHRCAACGAELPGGTKFCLECGKPIGTGSPGQAPDPRSYTPKHLAEKILTSRSALEGERKQVTVLFADVSSVKKPL
jgi:hypothetical protein